MNQEDKYVEVLESLGDQCLTSLLLMDLYNNAERVRLRSLQFICRTEKKLDVCVWCEVSYAFTSKKFCLV